MTTPKVPAADQTLRILSLLASARGPLPASAIARRLELPRSTVYQLLATMQDRGFVMHLPEARRYGLGLAAVELSSAYARHEPLARLGKPLIAALVDRVHESGHLAVAHGRDVLYVIEERAPGAPHLVTDVDVRLPMHVTASGLAILAALPRAQVRALFPDREALVPIAGYAQLRRVLDEVATRGYALETGTVTPGLSSIGVPVLDHRGWPVAGIAVTFPDGEDGRPARVDPARYPRVAEEVRAAAETLSARISGRGADQSAR